MALQASALCAHNLREHRYVSVAHSEVRSLVVYVMVGALKRRGRADVLALR